MGKNPESQSHQKTVLVVDDDKEILKLISTILVDSNYKVLTAANGSVALGLAIPKTTYTFCFPTFRCPE
jgi:CheY-like chemotaxis protein